MKKRLLKIKVEVSGKGIIYLPEYVRRKKICLYDVNYLESNRVIVTLDYNDLLKFFAICKNMCYNTKIRGFNGALSLLAYALKNVGITLGLIIFIIITIVTDNVVYKVECIGSGASFSNQIVATVNRLGIKKGSLFSDVNYSLIESEVLKTNSNLSFVTCYKNGNRLIIDSSTSSVGGQIVKPLESDLICQKNGIIESISVMRGTKLVDAGSAVKKGDALVGAYYVDEAEDKKYPSKVIATVNILVKEEYFFKTEVFSDIIENASIQKAKFLCDGEIVDVIATQTNGGYAIVVTARYTYYGG